jgi:hypothetical protein
MSSNANDCTAIEQRIDGQNLTIGATQDQMNKLFPDDPDVQNKRDALNRKLNNLLEQRQLLQHSLEDCRQGKGSNFPDLESISEGDAV